MYAFWHAELIDYWLFVHEKLDKVELCWLILLYEHESVLRNIPIDNRFHQGLLINQLTFKGPYLEKKWVHIVVFKNSLVYYFKDNRAVVAAFVVVTASQDLV